jgi:hypothetical protein
MKQLVAMLACAGLLAAAVPAATAQGSKTVKGSITSAAANAVTVKVGDKDMTFNVDAKTKVIMTGGSTKERQAQAAGKSGPTLTDVLKTGQAVEVSYQEQGMHAATIRTIASVPSAAPTGAPAAAPAAKSQTAIGAVSAVGGNSLSVKGESEWTFAVDNSTTVSGTGVGTAGKKLLEAGGKPTLTDFVHQGDTVAVTYHEMAGTKHADIVRITRKKM